jgi:hypothetical protein
MFLISYVMKSPSRSRGTGLRLSFRVPCPFACATSGEAAASWFGLSSLPSPLFVFFVEQRADFFAQIAEGEWLAYQLHVRIEPAVVHDRVTRVARRE